MVMPSRREYILQAVLLSTLLAACSAICYDRSTVLASHSPGSTCSIDACASPLVSRYCPLTCGSCTSEASTHTFEVSWGFTLTDATLTIGVGDSIQWNFDQSSVPHTVTSASFDSGSKSSGSFAQLFETAGDVDYVCTPHASMRGTIHVVQESEFCAACDAGSWQSAACDFQTYRRTQCQPITTCSLSEYRSTEATPTSDAVCKSLAVCSSGVTYEKDAPTVSSDRACATVLQCNVNQYESQSPTLTSNRVCRALTTCTDNEYISKAATVSSDRECRACEVCLASEYESSPCTASSNRVCTSLTICNPSTQFMTVAPTSTSNRGCAACTVCTAGQFAKSPCAGVSDRVCQNWQTCAVGTYLAAAGTATSDTLCPPCTNCTETPDLIELQSCTLSRNSVCASKTDSLCGEAIPAVLPSSQPSAGCLEYCNLVLAKCSSDSSSTTDCFTFCDSLVDRDSPVETFFGDSLGCRLYYLHLSSSNEALLPPSVACDIASSSGGSRCVASCPSSCTANSYRNELGECVSCSACSNGFKVGGCTGSTDTQCQAWSACAAGSFIQTPGTPSSDRICQTCATCPSGQYAANSCQGTSDTICVPWSACGANSFEDAAPSATSNRVCQACQTCAPGSYTAAPCSATHDTVCATCTMCAANNAPAYSCTLTRDTICTVYPIYLYFYSVDYDTFFGSGAVIEQRKTLLSAALSLFIEESGFAVDSITSMTFSKGSIVALIQTTDPTMVAAVSAAIINGDVTLVVAGSTFTASSKQDATAAPSASSGTSSGAIVGIVVGVIVAVLLVVSCIYIKFFRRAPKMDEIVNTPIKRFDSRPTFAYTSYKENEAISRKNSKTQLKAQQSNASLAGSAVDVDVKPLPGSVIAAFEVSAFTNASTTRLNPLFDADAINAVFEDEAPADFSDHESDISDQDAVRAKSFIGYDFETARPTIITTEEMSFGFEVDFMMDKSIGNTTMTTMLASPPASPLERGEDAETDLDDTFHRIAPRLFSISRSLDTPAALIPEIEITSSNTEDEPASPVAALPPFKHSRESDSEFTGFGRESTSEVLMALDVVDALNESAVDEAISNELQPSGNLQAMQSLAVSSTALIGEYFSVLDDLEDDNASQMGRSSYLEVGPASEQEDIGVTGFGEEQNALQNAVSNRNSTASSQHESLPPAPQPAILEEPELQPEPQHEPVQEQQMDPEAPSTPMRAALHGAASLAVEYEESDVRASRLDSVQSQSSGVSMRSQLKPTAKTEVLTIEDLPTSPMRSRLNTIVVRDLENFVENMNEAKGDDRIEFVRDLQQKCKNSSSIIKECVDMGGVVTLVDWLRDEDDTVLQRECVKTLAIIAGHEAGAFAIAYSGCISIMSGYITVGELYMDILLTLSSIGVLSPKMAELVLSSEALPTLHQAVRDQLLSRYDLPGFIDFIEIVCGKEELNASWQYVVPTVEACIELLHQNEIDISTRALKYLTSLLPRYPLALEFMLQHGIISRLKEHTKSPSEACRLAALDLTLVLVNAPGDVPRASIAVPAVAHPLLNVIATGSTPVILRALTVLQAFFAVNPQLSTDLTSHDDWSTLLALQFSENDGVRSKAEELISMFSFQG